MGVTAANARQEKATSAAQEKDAATPAVGPYRDFKGTIKLDIRDSKADWPGPARTRNPWGR
jgi:hypothetical protein